MVNTAIKIMMKIHSYSNKNESVKFIEMIMRYLINAPDGSLGKVIWNGYISEVISDSLSLPVAAPFVKDPKRFLRSMAMITKKYNSNEKGVVQVHYSYAIPIFMALFDIKKVMERYHIVLEPSWVGYCDGPLLSFAGLSSPIFVMSLEPKDQSFIKMVSNNMVPIDIAPNWYVDYRVFQLRPDVEKDADICMIAAWAKYKRHAEVLDTLSKLKKKGRVLRLILIGYKADLTKDDIYSMAKERGVESQVEIFENIGMAQVAEQLSRCKMNILWSKKEGTNRAIIEGFLCGVPGILREGHNFGYQYKYINEKTGTYASPKNLCEKILYLADNYEKYDPRRWVMENMTPQHATKVLTETIVGHIGSHNTGFSEKIYPKINGLDGLSYFDDNARDVLVNDYDFLEKCIKNKYISLK